MMSDTRLAHEFVALRVRHNETREQMATRLGIHPVRLECIEDAVYPPSEALLFLVYKAYGLDDDTFRRLQAQLLSVRMREVLDKMGFSSPQKNLALLLTEQLAYLTPVDIKAITKIIMQGV